jgi:DNA-binding transcriptional regulator LsrR (DeoR family)
VADPLARIQKALDRVRAADASAVKARQDFRRLANAEIAAGRATKSGIARALGVSRQRVQKMLED